MKNFKTISFTFAIFIAANSSFSNNRMNQEVLASEKNDRITLLFGAEDSLDQLLLEAVWDNESLEETKAAVKNGGNINLKNDQGEPLIHLAAQLDDTNILNYLLNAGADANALDKDGKNALWKTETDVAVYLLATKGTDVNQIIGKHSVLSYKIYRGWDAEVNRLISAGADVDYLFEGKSLMKYCKALLKSDERPGNTYSDAAEQAKSVDNWHANIEKIMVWLKQLGVK